MELSEFKSMIKRFTAPQLKGLKAAMQKDLKTKFNTDQTYPLKIKAIDAEVKALTAP